MALPLLSRSPCSLQPSLHRLVPLRAHQTERRLMSVRCVVETNSQSILEPARRSANYQPSLWNYDLVQSLKSDYDGEPHLNRVEELKREVKRLLRSITEPMARLELIDTLQRIGLYRHFEKEVLSDLEAISNDDASSDDLHATALRFRLLRQHGYKVSPDVFSRFMDGNGSFKREVCADVKAMLSLYEASQLGFGGESIMDEARTFTTVQLKAMMGQMDPKLAKRVDHFLKLPLHRRVLRFEVREFIDDYENEEGMNPVLLELAKLDFNMVQATHQSDLRKTSRWWKSLDLAQKLSFVRDRLVEHFMWAVATISDPRMSMGRQGLTKVTSLITSIDDVYDVYGTLEELELFTDAVDRWDINAIDQLPQYMKICFMALYNNINQMAYDVLKEQGFDITRHLRKSWADLCKAYLVEAKWYNAKYTPTFEEYWKNSEISIGGPVMLVHAYFLMGHKITQEAIQCVENGSKLIYWSSIVIRLCDDMGTATDELARGDNPKSIQCYMNQAGVSEDVAREHIKDLITDAWKKMNEECVNSTAFPQSFINACLDLSRVAQFMYQNGDGHGVPDKETKDQVMKFLVDPIQV